MKTLAHKTTRRATQAVEPHNERLVSIMRMIADKSPTDDYGNAIVAMWGQVDWEHVSPTTVREMVQTLFHGNELDDAKHLAARQDALTDFARSEHLTACVCCSRMEAA